MGGLTGAPTCVGQALPPPVEPVEPHTTAAGACAAAVASSSEWDFPSIDAATTTADARSYFVGRWLLCGGGGLSNLAHAGSDFGANNRWRLLTSNPTTGELVPMDTSSGSASGY